MRDRPLVITQPAGNLVLLRLEGGDLVGLGGIVCEARAGQRRTWRGDAGRKRTREGDLVEGVVWVLLESEEETLVILLKSVSSQAEISCAPTEQASLKPYRRPG